MNKTTSVMKIPNFFPCLTGAFLLLVSGAAQAAPTTWVFQNCVTEATTGNCSSSWWMAGYTEGSVNGWFTIDYSGSRGYFVSDWSFTVTGPLNAVVGNLGCPGQIPGYIFGPSDSQAGSIGTYDCSFMSTSGSAAKLGLEVTANLTATTGTVPLTLNSSGHGSSSYSYGNAGDPGHGFVSLIGQLFGFSGTMPSLTMTPIRNIQR